MLNPWIILAVVLAIVGAGGGGFASGHHFGTATGISVAVLTQTTSDAMASEGESLVAYVDAANPSLPTICYGEPCST